MMFFLAADSAVLLRPACSYSALQRRSLAVAYPQVGLRASHSVERISNADVLDKSAPYIVVAYLPGRTIGRHSHSCYSGIGMTPIEKRT